MRDTIPSGLGPPPFVVSQENALNDIKDKLKGQSDRGNSSVEASSSQETQVCIKMTKKNLTSIYITEGNTLNLFQTHNTK